MKLVNARIYVPWEYFNGTPTGNLPQIKLVGSDAVDVEAFVWNSCLAAFTMGDVGEVVANVGLEERQWC